MNWRRTSVAAAAAMAALVAAAALPASAATGTDSITITSTTPQPPGLLLIQWTESLSYPVDYYLVSDGTTWTRAGKADGQPTTLTQFLYHLEWGKSYNLSIEAVGVAPSDRTDSPSVFVQGYRLMGSAKADIIERGGATKILGTLTKAGSGGKPVRGGTIQLQRNPAPVSDGKWANVRTTTTSDTGRFRFHIAPSVTTAYRLLYSENGAGGWRAGILVGVKVKVSLSATPNPVRLGQPATFSGHLKAPDKLVAHSKVQLQRRVSGTWKGVASGRVDTNGRFAVAYKSPNSLDSYYRVVATAGSSFATSTSHKIKLVVN